MERLFNTLPKIMLYFTLMAMIGIAPACSLMPHGASGKNMIGYWEGNLKIPTGEEIKIEFEIFINADGDYRAFLKVPEQDDSAILVDNLTFENKIVRFSIMGDEGMYEGTLTGGSRIEGKLSQSGQTFPLVFERVE